MLIQASHTPTTALVASEEGTTIIATTQGPITLATVTPRLSSGVPLNGTSYPAAKILLEAGAMSIFQIKTLTHGSGSTTMSKSGQTAGISTSKW